MKIFHLFFRIVLLGGTLLNPAAGADREIHQRLVLKGNNPHSPTIALTLDACSGLFDQKLMQFLAQERIPATLFLTKKWIAKNPQGVAFLHKNRDLFAIENHGSQHIPAVIGAGKKVYGIQGHRELADLQREVEDGAKAITDTFGTAPRWYRAATARYDEKALAEIEKLGFQIAGFSVNVDAGATLSARSIVRRLHSVQAGDVLLAHMNHPASGTAQGLLEGLPLLRRNGFIFVRLDSEEVRSILP